MGNLELVSRKTDDPDIQNPSLKELKISLNSRLVPCPLPWSLVSGLCTCWECLHCKPVQKKEFPELIRQTEIKTCQLIYVLIGSFCTDVTFVEIIWWWWNCTDLFSYFQPFILMLQLCVYKKYLWKKSRIFFHSCLTTRRPQTASLSCRKDTFKICREYIEIQIICNNHIMYKLHRIICIYYRMYNIYYKTYMYMCLSINYTKAWHKLDKMWPKDSDFLIYTYFDLLSTEK